MPPTFPVIGTGFILRNFVSADAESLSAIETDLEVKQFLDFPLTREEWLKKFRPDEFSGWAVDVDGVLAGRASLLRIRGKRNGYRELVIVIGRPYWGARLGRKVAKELIAFAFRHDNINGFVACVHPEHKASMALLRQFKFRYRGVAKEIDSNCQAGNIIFRLSRGAYNSSIKPTASGSR